MEDRLVGPCGRAAIPVLLLSRVHGQSRHERHDRRGDRRRAPEPDGLQDQGRQAPCICLALDLLASARILYADESHSPITRSENGRMNPNMLMQDLKQMRSTVRLQGAALALMGACLLSSLVLMFNMVGRDRVVVTPPSIDKTFWVSKDRVSSSYLERVGSVIASLTLAIGRERCGWVE